MKVSPLLSWKVNDGRQFDDWGGKLEMDWVGGLDWRHFRNTPSAVTYVSYIHMHVDFSDLVVVYLI